MVIVKTIKVEDYYKTTKQKVLDFCLGLFGVWIVNGLISYLFYLISYSVLNKLMTSDTNLTFFYSISGIFYFIILALNIVVIVLSFKRNRRYIGIGILSAAVLIPLLIFGACVVMLSSI